jgi:hypothetical protein
MLPHYLTITSTRTGRNVTHFFYFSYQFSKLQFDEKIKCNLSIILVFFPYVIVYFVQCIIYLVQYSQMFFVLVHYYLYDSYF